MVNGSTSDPENFSPDLSGTSESEVVRGLSVPEPNSGSDSVSDLSPSSTNFPSVASTETIYQDVVESSVPSDAFLPQGTVLGHFCISNFIGGGGMGRVYLGIDQSLDRKVAIKVLQRQRAQDQAAVARFMNEARSAARLNHEHIAQVYYAGQQDEMPFIAFEYVEGVNVRTMVEQQGVFPLNQALTYMIQIADALNHAAAHGVIHRDVKPSNILITQAGRAKLIDMGLARLLRPTDPADDLTASGVTLGTFDYISPEQAHDPRNADIRSDIYSLGCTFYFMLTAQPPFPEGTVLQKLLQHQGEEPPDVRTVQPNLPVEVSLLVQKMMSKAPRQRFQTPALLLQELKTIANKIGLRPIGSGNTVWTMTEQHPIPRLFTHLPWVVGVLLLATGILGLKWFEKRNLTNGPPAGIIPPIIETNPDPQNSVPPIPTALPIKPDYIFLAMENNQEKGTNGHFNINGRIGPPRIGGEVTLRPQSSLIASVSSGAPLASSSSVSVIRPGWATSTMQTDSSPSPVLIVDPNGSATEKGVYTTLQDAITASGKKGTIELHFNGALKSNTKPFSWSLAGKQLRIQAGEGFSPILSFRPTDSLDVKNGRINFFVLNGGDISFHNIAFELDVSSNVIAARWSLFEILGPIQLEFSKCTFVTRNTLAGVVDVYHKEVAFFRVASSGASEMTGSQQQLGGLPTNSSLGVVGGSKEISGFSSSSATGSSKTTSSNTGNPVKSGRTTGEDSGLPMVGTERNQSESDTEWQSVSIAMNNCVLRGETSVLSCETFVPVNLTLNNAFVAIALPFFNVEELWGGNPAEGHVHLTLNHVSLYGKAPLSHIVKEKGFPSLLHRWTVLFSVIRLNQKPFAQLVGFGTREEAQACFQSEGEWNFLQGVSTGVEIRSGFFSTPMEISLADWQRSGWSNTSSNANIFQGTALLENKRTNYMLPADLAIAPRSNNPAYQSVPLSEDNRLEKEDAGQLIRLLPKVSAN